MKPLGKLISGFLHNAVGQTKEGTQYVREGLTESLGEENAQKLGDFVEGYAEGGQCPHDDVRGMVEDSTVVWTCQERSCGMTWDKEPR